ncbi:hypothetical protein AAC387_Pa01g0615 [Persea americana]
MNASNEIEILAYISYSCVSGEDCGYTSSQWLAYEADLLVVSSNHSNCRGVRNVSTTLGNVIILILQPR